MKMQPRLELAQKQKMQIGRKVLLAGISVVAIAAVGIVGWHLVNSEKTLASTAKTEVSRAQILNAASIKTASPIATENTSATEGRKEEKAAIATASRGRVAFTSSTITIASEEMALDAISRQLSENGKDFAIMTETTNGKVNMATTYTYPGRPDMSAQELQDLRSSNRSQSNGVATNLIASTEALPDLNATENNGIRNFEVADAKANQVDAVKLSKFSCQRKFNNILLSWNTDFEKYNDYFAIEKSTNGKTFKEIGKVNGAGDYKAKLLYTFLDRHPEDGPAWYRIHQYDFSGNDKIFPAKKIK
jgi:hypothetical protein